MYPGQYFMPYGNMITNPRNYIIPGRMGLLGRIGNSIKRFNWGNLLTNANKTLNVVNQTIPLVRQAGPMFNNMKSMFKLARAFGNETNSSIKSNKKRTISNKKNVQNNIQYNNKGDLPNFFI